MPRTVLNALLTERALSFMAVNRSPMGHNPLADQIIDAAPADAPIKNVCAKVSTTLSDDIDRVCFELGMSKRVFLEAAMIEAVRQADEVCAQEGVNAFFAGEEGA